MPDVTRLTLDDTLLLVIDLQAKLVPVMHDRSTLVRRAARLVEAARKLALPVIVTEQYRKGLGPTVPEVARLLGETATIEKLAFSACVPEVLAAIEKTGRKTVLITGIEAHICVLQTSLDLLQAGFIPAVAWDATSSRRPIDRDMAVRRLTQAGAVPTTVEAALMELAGTAEGDAFRAIRGLIKGE